MTVSDDVLQELLAMDRVVVVGCSSTPGKAAHEIPAYLQRQGYEIIPVNPFTDEILGEPAVDSLQEIDGEINLVNVFRPSEEVDGIVDDVIARKNAAGDLDGLWLQLGIQDADAETRAKDAGLTVVSDRCMKVEHQRLRS